MIQNGSVYNFFTEGKFRIHIPGLININHRNDNAPQSLDFIGLNYYSNRHLFLTQTVKPSNPEICSDNEIYYRYPQGMYRAIVELSEKVSRPLNIPLYVAENGIATNDDEKRYKFYHEYLYAISKAMDDGYKVYGYLPWTLASNYEWPLLDDNKERDYGICSVNPRRPSQLRAKLGSKSYLEFVSEFDQLEKQLS